jgi:hypothetical protein
MAMTMISCPIQTDVTDGKPILIKIENNCNKFKSNADYQYIYDNASQSWSKYAVAYCTKNTGIIKLSCKINTNKLMFDCPIIYC